jgi:tRNA-binding protein
VNDDDRQEAKSKRQKEEGKRQKGVRMIPVPVKPLVAMSDLEKVDIRVGTIREVLDVPGSGKLVQLTVSFGDHERRILAGLKKERPDPGALVGKQALFVVNLEPRRMAGVLSEGMLFDLGYADGIVPVLAQPETPVPDGCRAG